MEAKIVKVGNSKGIRIPKRLLVKYGLRERVVLKEAANGILIEKKGKGKLTWEETYKVMAHSEEAWSKWSEMDMEEIE